MNSLWLWVCTCINAYLCVCDYTVLTEASMVEDNTQQEKPKKKFSSELRLFLLMPNVESILWILLLLFITVGQFFVKFFVTFDQLPIDLLEYELYLKISKFLSTKYEKTFLLLFTSDWVWIKEIIFMIVIS